MSFTDSLLVSILGTVVVWILTTVILHVIKKLKLQAALIADITINIAGMKEQQSAVTKLVEDHAIEGQKLTFPISYKMGEYVFYKSIQNDLLTYLNKTELVKVIKFYQGMWELDTAINGIALTLSTWERDKITLASEHVSHIKKRKDRIDSFCNVICSKEIRKLKELPDNYNSIKRAETVVSRT